MNLTTGQWSLAQLRAGTVGLAPNGLKVFSCFSCGGGSSMGYKLAGFTMAGFCEIDPKMARVYQANMMVEFPYVMSVAELNVMLKAMKPHGTMPHAFTGLDILDGSPPCSSFSTSGNREDDWGKDKVFREGQAKQVLDDLFFDFIETAHILQTPIVVAENVKGLIMGDAKKYVAEIFLRFNDAGYDTQLFLLNASSMGVPQRRERTFFIARRKDLKLPPMAMQFDEPTIGISNALAGIRSDGAKQLTKKALSLWKKTYMGDSFSVANNGSWFNWKREHPNRVCSTMPATSTITHWREPRHFSDHEVCVLQSFPSDYNFGNNDARYVCGMSVPPFMMQRVAGEIARQAFKVSQPDVPVLGLDGLQEPSPPA